MFILNRLQSTISRNAPPGASAQVGNLCADDDKPKYKRKEDAAMQERWWRLTIKRNEHKEVIYAQSIVPLLHLIYDRDDQDNIKFKLKTVKK